MVLLQRKTNIQSGPKKYTLFTHQYKGAVCIHFFWATLYIGLHVQCSAGYYCEQIVMKLEFSQQIFDEYSNIKFHENPSSGNRVVPRGRQTDGQADITNLIVVFRNFVDAHKHAQNFLTG
jgi:hypothetical protein